MNDLFRAIFGTPTSDRHGQREDDGPRQNYRNNFWGNRGNDDDDDGDDGDDDLGVGSHNGIFGFPLFSNPFEIHKHLDKLLDGMNKAFEVFGFDNGPSITWESGSTSSSFYKEEQEPRQENLRDIYLKKPDCCCDNNNQRDDFNIKIKFQASDLEPGTSGNSNSVQYSYPKVYSKSVYIQTVRRPDGSVETIKKVTDHEGNEKTIISQSKGNEPFSQPEEEPSPPEKDTSGISIFKKFFSF